MYISTSGFSATTFEVRVDFETPSGFYTVFKETLNINQSSSGLAELFVEETSKPGEVKCSVKVNGQPKQPTYLGCLSGNCFDTKVKTKLCFEYAGGPTVNSSICQ